MHPERYEKIRELLAKASDREIEPEHITPETRLRDDLEFDSLQSVHFMLDIEDKFGASVPDERIKGLVTVADVYALVDEVIAAREKLSLSA
jgi:acyl carrier protein